MLEKKPYPVNVVVFHKGAHRHADDGACRWGLNTRPEAEYWFPGVSQAEEIFDGTGGEKYEGMSGDEFLVQERTLFIGTGGGILDAHPGPGNPGKNECEFALLCEWIGIKNDPAMQKILQYIIECDRGNAGHPMAIGSVAKILEYAPATPMEVFAWQALAFEALYQKQLEFAKAEQEYSQKAVREEVRIGGRKIIVATITSENPHIKDVMLSWGDGILVQQRPFTAEVLPGNIQVFTNRKFRLDLSKAISLIRQEEQRLNGRPVTTDVEMLRSRGKMAGVPEWFYLVGDAGQSLLNGAWSAPDTPHSRIPRDVVRNLVVSSLQ